VNGLGGINPKLVNIQIAKNISSLKKKRESIKEY
jgi:hypothetical protein